MNILLSTAYWPNLHYFFYVLNAESIFIEKHEHYQKQSFRNRTQILSANGILNLSIPVVNNNKQIITDIEICYKENWQKNHWRAITSAYKNSPYFEFFEEDIYPFYITQFKYLFEYNFLQLQLILKLLKRPKSIYFSDSYEITTEKKLDFRNLIHPKINVENDESVATAINTNYYQTFSSKFNFTPNLSILDVLFNMGLDTLKILEN
ncbi:MAG: WbqC family protein [Bacteroidota bacterium]|nr:WbqC family protein [Bacteroidota bacterium]